MATPSSAWESEIKTLSDIALIGTARFAEDARAALHGELPVDEFLARVDVGMSLERRVLLTAAVRAAYDRAGRSLPSNVEPFTAAPSETRATAANPVTALVMELITTQPPALLREALERLMRAELIVAPGTLPALLDVRDSRVRDILPHVIGERGRWVSTLDERAAWLLDVALEPRTIWQEGTHAQRIAVLREQRAVAPADARAWLAETWAQEKAEHRVQFLELFGVGLSSADASLLEDALADRSIHVRASAARLLSAIADSDTAARLSARADAFLGYEPPSGVLARVRSAIGSAAAGTLTATPPQAFEQMWERDGIAARPAKGVGERAHWLTELLALVRPAHWEERFGASARDLVRAAIESEWSQAILLAWSRAAVTHRSSVWITALWDGWRHLSLENATPTDQALRRMMREQLGLHMPPDDAEARVLEALGAPEPEMRAEYLALLEAIPVPWRDEFAHAVLRELARATKASTGPDQQLVRSIWIDYLERISPRLPRALFDDALALEAEMSATESLFPAQQRKLEQIRQLVQLRERIHQEIPL